MIKKRFKEYFNFTKKERNGIIVLLFILVILLAVNLYVKNKTSGNIQLMSDDFQNEIEQFEKSLEQKEKVLAKKDKNILKDVDVNLNLFEFDPNTITRDELKALGLNKRQISTILNYRKKGGRFYKKEDLLKIYGIDDDLYTQLEPYIQLNQENNNDVGAQENAEINENTDDIIEFTSVELNSATLEELISLPGIGEYYANKIINYRELLRGYHNKSQLLEVYGFDSSRYAQIENLINIDTSLIEPININTSIYKTIIRHPYLNKYQTNTIMKYRELSGKFNSLEQLVEFNVLTKHEYLKVKPYLITDTLNKSLTND